MEVFVAGFAFLVELEDDFFADETGSVTNVFAAGVAISVVFCYLVPGVFKILEFFTGFLLGVVVKGFAHAAELLAGTAEFVAFGAGLVTFTVFKTAVRLTTEIAGVFGLLAGMEVTL